ncbi:MAG: hypothetical protein COA43_15635 [Robiginitomaculum sp.]|nr:MAG: hypothetical protein COA43_15635 [Robiginitomaculum sp.]
MDIHKGDLIRWRRKDYANGIQNMQRGTIQSINDHSVKIKMLNGKTVQYAKEHPQLKFLSHAWAQTGHAYQGQTIDHIIAAMPSVSGLTTQKSFYVDISRARHEITFLTDNIERVRDTLKEQTGDSLTALDIHREKEAALEIDTKTKEPIPELERERERPQPQRGR